MPPIIHCHPAGARAADLAAAERSNLREGLPPSSPLARELERRVVSGALTFAQAIEALGEHYRQDAAPHGRG